MPTQIIKPAYLAAGTAVAITADGLASGSARQSAKVDNTANLYDDVLVTVKIPVAAGTPAGQQAINIYLARSANGTDWADNVTGLDAAITLLSPNNLRLAASIATPAAARTYVIHLSVAAVFDGVMPPFWAVVVEDQTGCAFSTGTSVVYEGLQWTVG